MEGRIAREHRTWRHHIATQTRHRVLPVWFAACAYVGRVCDLRVSAPAWNASRCVAPPFVQMNCHVPTGSPP
ncbi:hypothetical protein FOA52_003186 [Chlamydomonas sp. UWO 241]|nr:hypothetical protein FOA52_003186 [Chlamydomonas sp. UWO 241]